MKVAEIELNPLNRPQSGAPPVSIPRRPAPAPNDLEFQGEKPQQPQAPPSLEDTRRQLEDLNRIMDGLGSRMQFSVYQDTDQFYVQLVDRASNEVLKVMPAEHILELRARIGEAVGVFLDEER